MHSTSDTHAPRRIRLAGSLGIGLLAVLLAACGTGTTNGGGPAAGTETPMQSHELEQSLPGVWGSETKGSPHLRFDGDGNVSGNDGCNGLTGRYAVEEDRVVVTGIASTLMACPGVDTWLRALSTLTVHGDTMTVSDKGGNDIGRLQREG